jgi:hypothetical protein
VCLCVGASVRAYTFRSGAGPPAQTSQIEWKCGMLAMWMCPLVVGGVRTYLQVTYDTEGANTCTAHRAMIASSSCVRTHRRSIPHSLRPVGYGYARQGRAVSELVLDGKCKSLDLAPFDPARFSD